MPVYNGSKFLKTSIDSVNKQTLKDIELICVDDGSTDNSFELLNNFSKEFDFIKVFSQENQGSGKARNYGIQKAIGEYIAFLDADDIFIDDDALEKMYDVGHKHGALMVGGNLKRINSKGDILDNPNYPNKNYRYFDDYKLIPPTKYGVPWAFYKNIFQREFIINEQIEFPDLLRGQDPVFLAEILSLIHVIYTVPVDLYGYNYSVFGQPENKINTHDKKRDYILHFKQVIDIFDENNFKKQSREFKKKLMGFLKLSSKNNDYEVYEIFHEIFDNPLIYFRKFREDIDIFDLNYFISRLDNCENDEDFSFYKNKIMDINLVKNNKVSKELLRKTILIDDSTDLEDYKSKLIKFNINNLKHANNKLKNDNKKIKNENKKLKKKVKKLKKFNKSILNSSSWKITKSFRRG